MRDEMDRSSSEGEIKASSSVPLKVKGEKHLGVWIFE